MQNEAVQDKRQQERESTTHAHKHLRVEWAKSEWFRIYLQMARRERQPAEQR